MATVQLSRKFVVQILCDLFAEDKEKNVLPSTRHRRLPHGAEARRRSGIRASRKEEISPQLCRIYHGLTFLSAVMNLDMACRVLVIIKSICYEKNRSPF